MFDSFLAGSGFSFLCRRAAFPCGCIGVSASNFVSGDFRKYGHSMCCNILLFHK